MNNVLKGQQAYYQDLYRRMAPSASKKTNLAVAAPEDEWVDALETAEQCWNSYANSPEGENALNNIGATSFEQIQEVLRSAFQSPEFEPLRTDLESLGIESGTFTMGLCFAAELGIGGSVTIGVAVGLDWDVNIDFSAYVGVGGSLGLEAGISFAATFGLWTTKAQNLGGWSASVGGMVEDVVGGGVVVTWNLPTTYDQMYDFDFDILSTMIPDGVTLVAGVGITDGETQEIGYTWVMGYASPDSLLRPEMQPTKSYVMNLYAIECKDQTDGVGDEDEVYLTFQADGDQLYYYPTYGYNPMKEDDTWTTGRSIYFNENVVFNLYDYDDLTGDDNIATKTVHLHDFNDEGQYNFHFKDDSGNTLYDAWVELMT